MQGSSDKHTDHKGSFSHVERAWMKARRGSEAGSIIRASQNRLPALLIDITASERFHTGVGLLRCISLQITELPRPLVPARKFNNHNKSAREAYLGTIIQSPLAQLLPKTCIHFVSVSLNATHTKSPKKRCMRRSGVRVLPEFNLKVVSLQRTRSA